jgi:multidrug efflux system membrane fusion protein
MPPVTVSTVIAKRENVPIYDEGLGTVTALNTVTVHTRVDGQIMSVNYREGQFVHEGDLLVQIDPRPFEIALAQAQAALQRDQAQLKSAQADLSRDLALQKAQVIAQQQVDQQNGLVGQLEGTVKLDESNIAAARLNLAYTRVTAPLTGLTGLRLVDVGNVVHASDTTGIVVITQVQPIAVDFSLPERELPNLLHAKAAGSVPADAYDSNDVNLLDRGRVVALNNQINSTTGTELVKSQFPNPGMKLWPNQFVNVRVLVRTDRNVVVVPAAAIQRNGTESYVFVVGPDEKAAVRPVTVAYLEGNLAVIQQGVAAGDTVVTEGQDHLQAGAVVRARAAQTPPLRLHEASSSAGAP